MRIIEDNGTGRLFSVHYSQRDLEDQIEEEYQKRGQTYQRTNNTKIMSEVRKLEAPKVSAKEVLSLLSKGYTRYKEDDIGYGSIEEHFNLSPAQVKSVFKYPSLKARKTKVPMVEVIDDLNAGTDLPCQPPSEVIVANIGTDTVIHAVPYIAPSEIVMISHPVAVPTEQQDVVVTTTASAVSENDLFN